jgi:hypothetical protein
MKMRMGRDSQPWRLGFVLVKGRCRRLPGLGQRPWLLAACVDDPVCRQTSTSKVGAQLGLRGHRRPGWAGAGWAAALVAAPAGAIWCEGKDGALIEYGASAVVQRSE